MTHRPPIRIATAGVAVTSLLALSACGGGDDAADADAWILTGGGWPTIDEDLERWNEQAEDGQQISVEEFENDAYKERIRTVVGSGEAPTLIMSWTGGALNEYVAQDRVVDLTDEVGELESRIHESVWQNGEVEGAQYAVPMNDVQPVVMYYNQELFDQVDLEVPQDWSDVEEAIEVFNENDITPFSVAGGSVWPALMWLQYLTDRHGGEEVFQAVVDGEAGAWSEESILFALETIQELATEGGFDADTFTGVDAGQNEDARLLADGEAAMLLQGSWVYATVHSDFPDFAESGDFGFAEFPVLEDGAGDPSNIVGNPANFWSVSADSSEEEQQVALDYITEHLYNEETVQTMVEGGGLPPLNDIDDVIAETEDADFLQFADELVAGANHFQLSWDQAVAPEVAQPLMENLENILLGTITPEEFAENMNAYQD
ncbi:extracellular solute-binding protein [Nesterenkonia sp. HG001]|uniref:extracellular solute-binding protein n=1 Tax=Nesterenkonia sp. HG001 TaxID=2983207 RepID=UPI002AC5052E|nr:extracellular solute-binding protein [Nesterenkonia sp. HG001]MDZ5078239.1 extracellular solute-binding protein [Nesterenkonia sp. HG001]